MSTPSLRTLRALTNEPDRPSIISVATHGSEYAAVQAVKSGAFDYLLKNLPGRESNLAAVTRARHRPSADRGAQLRRSRLVRVRLGLISLGFGALQATKIK
jgi:FixJ family two-component response regulator